MQRTTALRPPKQSSGNCSEDNTSADDDTEMADADLPADQPLFDTGNSPHQTPSPEPDSIRPDRRAHVEEVEDEEARVGSHWVADYPEAAGSKGPLSQMYFEKYRSEKRESGGSLWMPFEDQEEWELAEWIGKNVGQNATNEFLKLPIVSSSNHDQKQTLNVIQIPTIDT